MKAEAKVEWPVMAAKCFMSRSDADVHTLPANKPANPQKTTAFVRTSTVTKMKTFNNQSSAGKFLACYNETTGLLDGDLVTDVEAAILGL